MRRLLPATLAGAIVAAGTVGAAAAPAYAATTRVVGPGQSIQAAVNAAHAGDTIVVKPGRYHESVFVRKNGLKIKGSGNGSAGTVLMPGRPQQGNPCSQHGGNGFCVFGSNSSPVRDVRITGFRIQGFGGTAGVFAFRTANLKVDNVLALNNGGYGIFRLASTGGEVTGNITVGSQEAGIYIGDSPTARVFVGGNISTDNGIGIFWRHARQGAVEYNQVFGNCLGILVLDDGQQGGSGSVLIAKNTVRANNKACPASDDAPPTSGGGIILFGATKSVVANNSVLNNSSSAPSVADGGIVLLSAAMFHGHAASGNLIKNNVAFRNSTDIDTSRAAGSNDVNRNTCHTDAGGHYCHN